MRVLLSKSLLSRLTSSNGDSWKLLPALRMCHGRAFYLTPLLPVALAVLGAAAVPAQSDLRIGARVEQRLAGGETHSYGIEVSPGARLRIAVEQRGIDVVLELLRPDGSTLIAVDSPTDSEGPESILLPP